VLRQWETSCTSAVKTLTDYLKPLDVASQPCGCLLKQESEGKRGAAGLLCPGLLARRQGQDEGLSLMAVLKLFQTQTTEDFWVLNKAGKDSSAPTRFVCALLLQLTGEDAWRRHDFVLPVVVNASTYKGGDASEWVRLHAGRQLPGMDPVLSLVVHPEGYDPLSELWRPDLFLLGTYEQLQTTRRALQGYRNHYRRLVFLSVDGMGPSGGAAVELSRAVACTVQHGAEYDTIQVEMETSKGDPVAPSLLTQLQQPISLEALEVGDARDGAGDGPLADDPTDPIQAMRSHPLASLILEEGEEVKIELAAEASGWRSMQLDTLVSERKDRFGPRPESNYTDASQARIMKKKLDFFAKCMERKGRQALEALFPSQLGRLGQDVAEYITEQEEAVSARPLLPPTKHARN